MSEELESGTPEAEAVEETVTEFTGVDVPLEGDTVVRIGDWEGPASNVRKSWIPQSGLQEMREKDKAEISRQVELARREAGQEAATKYQEQLLGLQRQMQPQPQQPQQQQQAVTGWDSVREKALASHQGYIHADQMGDLVNMFRNELAARDKAYQGHLQQLGHNLNNWHTDYQGQMQTLGNLSGGHANTKWEGFIDELHTEFGDTLPRENIDMVARGYELGPQENAADMKVGIRNRIQGQVTAFKAMAGAANTAEKEQIAKVAAAGMPGVGGGGSPSKKGKLMTDASEIADHFINAGGPPS